MKKLVEHLIGENGEYRNFGYLPDVRRNYPCQFGTSTSESFSERIISAANLLAETHCTHLSHDNIGKMVVLRMIEKFMERVQRKKAFTSIEFQHVLSVDEYVSLNEK